MIGIAPSALEGLRLLDLSGPPGHFCGKLLADMGADVIKVEPPDGDPGRRIGPFAGDTPDGERSLFWWAHNTNKRSVTLDIAAPAGAALLRRLVVTSDVVLETCQPGYLDSLGLGYQQLRAVRPALVACSLTPFGQDGPWADWRASDLVNQALGGQAYTSGYDDVSGAPPMRLDGHQAWHIGSTHAFIGILAALFHRDRTGRGQHLDLSIHAACNTCTEWSIPNWVYHRTNVIRQTGRHAALRPTAPWQYPTADGRYLNVLGILPRDNRSWRQLIAWMGREGAAGDLTQERYADVLRLRGQTQPGRDVVLDSPEAQYAVEQIVRFVASRPAEVLYRGAQSIGLPWAMIRDPGEALADGHFEDRGFWVTLPGPGDRDGGQSVPVTYPGAPYVFSRTPWRLAHRAPHLGEHNEAVYLGELRLSEAELAVLRRDGII